MHLEGWEIGRSALAALVAAVAVGFAVYRLPVAHTHAADVWVVAAGSVVWAAAVFLVLKLTGSGLLAQVLRTGKGVA